MYVVAMLEDQRCLPTWLTIYFEEWQTSVAANSIRFHPMYKLTANKIVTIATGLEGG